MMSAAEKSLLTLVLATRNRHKAAEIQAILGPAVACRTLEDFPGAPSLQEHADSFAGNAADKASQLADWLAASTSISHCLVLADDSGLEVDALQGAPGVRSARFAADELLSAGNAPDQANNAKLLRLLEDTPTLHRTARFRCVLAVVEILPDHGVGKPRWFNGTCEGRIGYEPTGDGGFGYDPLFLPAGLDCTFAQLDENEKNRISHRRKALDALQAWLLTRPERSGGRAA